MKVGRFAPAKVHHPMVGLSTSFVLFRGYCEFHRGKSLHFNRSLADKTWLTSIVPLVLDKMNWTKPDPFRGAMKGAGVEWNEFLCAERKSHILKSKRELHVNSYQRVWSVLLPIAYSTVFLCFRPSGSSLLPPLVLSSFKLPWYHCWELPA